MSLITNDLLGDFPFVSPAERAHAVALLLLPFVRSLIDGPTPLHLIEKPTPGTGGSLLAEVLAFPALGHVPAAMTEGREEEEWRKRVTATLLEAPDYFFIDNLRRPLDSAALSAAITASSWKDRVLGRSETARVRVLCAWMATGNNPVLSQEMSRRSVRIRLDARVDRPWLREGFRHPDLQIWARRHRADLVWAALTIAKAWVANGRPLGHKTLGMFDSWAKILGGMLEVAGIPGFLTNLQEMYDLADAEGAETRAFLGTWWDRYLDAEVTAKQLFELVTSTEAPLDLDAKSEQGRRVSWASSFGVFGTGASRSTARY